MKKTLAIIALTGLAFTSPFALADDIQRNERLCPFTETVIINKAPDKTHILRLSGDGLVVEKIGESQFKISNNRNCSNGTATVQIGTDSQNYSEITFHDGPWLFMDIKSVSNVGKLKFDKWEPDHTRHYYKLNFVAHTETNMTVMNPINANAG